MPSQKNRIFVEILKFVFLRLISMEHVRDGMTWYFSYAGALLANMGMWRGWLAHGWFVTWMDEWEELGLISWVINFICLIARLGRWGRVSLSSSNQPIDWIWRNGWINHFWQAITKRAQRGHTTTRAGTSGKHGALPLTRPCLYNHSPLTFHGSSPSWASTTGRSRWWPRGGKI